MFVRKLSFFSCDIIYLGILFVFYFNNQIKDYSYYDNKKKSIENLKWYIFYCEISLIGYQIGVFWLDIAIAFMNAYQSQGLA